MFAKQDFLGFILGDSLSPTVSRLGGPCGNPLSVGGSDHPMEKQRLPVEGGHRNVSLRLTNLPFGVI